MRRSPIVLTATAAGLAAVLGFDAHQPSLPSASASASATPTDTPTQSGTTRTATGDAVDTRYGAAQVKVTITNGKITDVEALRLQGNDPQSVQISSAAEPQLRASALAKQTAAIDAVSGATITSASYEASLQSALDKLGYEAPDGSRGSSTIPEVEEHHGGPFG
jgi:uncharacterized protein with FMN-binding domain